jgi:hypothetical protein
MTKNRVIEAVTNFIMEG